MAGPVKATTAMIKGMAPIRDAEVWHFCTSTDAGLVARVLSQALATFDEGAEGQSLILPDAAARAHGFATDLPMTRITLSVHSALDGVGLTAAVATALSHAGIPCNMVAAFHHDHAFVPMSQADQAMDILRALAQGG